MQKRRKDFKSERRENSIAGKKYGIISFTLTLVIFLVHLIFGELLLGPVSLRTHLLVTWLVSISLTLSLSDTHSSFECTNTRTLMMLTRTLSHPSARTPCALRIARETKFLHQMSKDVKVRLSICLVVSVCVCLRERETFLLKD